MNGVSKSKSQFEDNPLAQAILREGLRIQDRFSAETIYAKTGKGHLKSVGIEEIAEAKKSVKNRIHEHPRVVCQCSLGVGNLAELLTP